MGEKEGLRMILECVFEMEGLVLVEGGADLVNFVLRYFKLRFF